MKNTEIEFSENKPKSFFQSFTEIINFSKLIAYKAKNDQRFLAQITGQKKYAVNIFPFTFSNKLKVEHSELNTERLTTYLTELLLDYSTKRISNDEITLLLSYEMYCVQQNLKALRLNKINTPCGVYRGIILPCQIDALKELVQKIKFTIERLKIKNIDDRTNEYLIPESLKQNTTVQLENAYVF